MQPNSTSSDMVPEVQALAGEPSRYLVRSSQLLDPPYLVDLDEYAGNGACSCADFIYRRRPELDKGTDYGPMTRCRHIRLARAYR
jgi:hypothetical protein